MATDDHVDLKVNGMPLNENAKYTLATSDFVGLNGGDGYEMLKQGRVLIPKEQGKFDSDVLRSAIVARRTIAPKIEGRIKRLDIDQKQQIDCK